jgi:hypothetical protein
LKQRKVKKDTFEKDVYNIEADSADLVGNYQETESEDEKEQEVEKAPKVKSVFDEENEDSE